jgi:hypothetical protein
VVVAVRRARCCFTDLIYRGELFYHESTNTRGGRRCDSVPPELLLAVWPAFRTDVLGLGSGSVTQQLIKFASAIKVCHAKN